MNDEYERLWRDALEVQELYPAAVFIGGLAVAAHVLDLPGREELAAPTHDADLMIPLADVPDMVEREGMLTNRRLDKREFFRDGFAFDVYVQREHKLAVPYEDAYAAGEVSGRGLRVASWEHLLLLKADAVAERRLSSAGEKDGQDIARLLIVGTAKGGLQGEPSAYWTPKRLAAVRASLTEGAALLAGGNPHEASRLRRDIERLAHSLDIEKRRKSAPAPGP